MRLSILLTIFFLQLLLVSDALACSCMPKPTLLEEIEQSKQIVAIRLASIDRITEPSNEGYSTGGIRASTAVITRVFKGDLKAGQEIRLGQGSGADCVWTFNEMSVGREYLLYLDKPVQGNWLGPTDDLAGSREWKYYVSGCGRSTTVEAAKGDLAYLRQGARVAGKTRLSGKLEFGWDEPNPPSLSGIPIKIVGKRKSVTLKTDQDGFFEIYDLPPGEYVAHVTSPSGFVVSDFAYFSSKRKRGFDPSDPRAESDGNKLPVLIEKGSHAEMNQVMLIDTWVRGKVLSPTGRPISNVCVTAVLTDIDDAAKYRGPSSCTNDAGEYSIENLRRGTYWLIVNDYGEIDGSRPFGRVYYPGVTDIKAAGVIALEPGKHIGGREIQIPQFVELVSIKGRLLFTGDEPAADRSVYFVPNDSKAFREMSAQTDDRGNFEFLIPKGATGKMRGEIGIYKDEVKDCPSFEALLIESGRNYLRAGSTVLEIDPSAPPAIVELRFNFSACQRKHE